jgi:hypothetical protein
MLHFEPLDAMCVKVAPDKHIHESTRVGPEWFHKQRRMPTEGCASIAEPSTIAGPSDSISRNSTARGSEEDHDYHAVRKALSDVRP